MRRRRQVNLLAKKSGSAKVLCVGRNRLRANLADIAGSVDNTQSNADADQLAASSLRFCQKPRP